MCCLYKFMPDSSSLKNFSKSAIHATVEARIRPANGLALVATTEAMNRSVDGLALVVA